MFEVGDLVRLSVTNRDSDGNPVDTGAAAVVVTQPDGTAAAGLPPVQHATPGLYWIDFPAIQAGRHLARWTGSGPSAFAFADAVNVWPTDPRFLISLADAKRAVQKSSRPSSIDEDLRLYIAAVTPVIEDITGPLVQRPRTEYFDGGVDSVLLDAPPVPGSVVTVVESGFASTSFYVNYRSGIVHASNSGSNGGSPRSFAPGRQNVVVTYTVGEQVIPPNLLLAAREELRFLWQIGQQSEHPGMGDDDTEVEYSPSGFAVPRRVAELCAAHPRVPGFA